MRTRRYRCCLRPLTPYEPSKRTPIGTLRVVVEPPQCDGQLALDLEMPSAAPKTRGPNPAPPPLDRMLVVRMVTAILEAHEGRRPPSQVRPLLEAELYQRLLTGTRPSARPFVVRKVHTCVPAEDAVEACATVHTGTRVFALAARFEKKPSGWRCTSFELVTPNAARHRMSA